MDLNMLSVFQSYFMGPFILYRFPNPKHKALGHDGNR